MLPGIFGGGSLGGVDWVGLALGCCALESELEMSTSDGESLEESVSLPDEISAFVEWAIAIERIEVTDPVS